ncbi:M81 family metallopeptidase [Rhodobacteraceae bacterium LMO-12]|nr:M81 family metallopeptidase [Rhodobacteraceae bacterium LMO-JJ12]
MKIGVARLWHEANSFTATTVGLDHFEGREYAYGTQAAQQFRGTTVETGGAFEWADRTGAELVFSRLAASAPGGPVEQDLLDRLTDEIVNDPVFEGVDGIYLSMHGSCIGTQDASPETTLVQRMRARFPDLPITASFDMHCIPTAEMCAALDGATVYRKYPHTDMPEAAICALDLLADLITRGGRGKVVLACCDLILPSFNMRTDEPGPMTEIEDLACQMEAEQIGAGQPLAIYPYGSFAYADVPAANSGVMVSTTRAEISAAVEAAQSAADRMVAEMRARAPRFRPELAAAETLLKEVPWRDGRRWAILEPSDNPMSGGNGDTTGLLAAALEADLPEGTVFAFIADQEAVKAAHQAGEGAALTLALGGKRDVRFGGPVTVQGVVERLTDGKFINSGPMEHGIPIDLGLTALIRVGRMRIIVTSRVYSPNDPGYFHVHGIEATQIPLLLAKAKNHIRASFGNSFDAFAQVETPGPAMADTTQLPFRRIPPERLKLVG